MVEMNQFGSVPPGSAQVCGRCEALLMDVLDGTASAEDQRFFDGHVASCTGCSQMLADAQRGGAWLEMLRSPRPEPPAALFERILAQTSGLVVSDVAVSAVNSKETFAGGAIYPGVNLDGTVAYTPPALKPAQYGSVLKVLPFRVRGTLHRLSQTMLQPRLAMTAAMAFFSIALTLNLTGVHVSELRMSDLRPTNLRREFYEANAHVVRYCDNLRVVYELEARAHDLQRTADNDGTAPTQQDGQTSAPRKPETGDHPEDKPSAPKSSPKPGPGTSQRQPLTHDKRMVAALAPSNVDADTGSPYRKYLKGDQA